MRDEDKPQARPGVKQVIRRTATFDLAKIDAYRRAKGNDKTMLKVNKELRDAGFSMSHMILMTVDKRRALVTYEQDQDIASREQPTLLVP